MMNESGVVPGLTKPDMEWIQGFVADILDNKQMTLYQTFMTIQDMKEEGELSEEEQAYGNQLAMAHRFDFPEDEMLHPESAAFYKEADQAYQELMA